MKRILSMILSLIMVFSLFSVIGVSAFADEDELTIVLTGGTGTAIGGEGIGFATAAAIKATYDNDAVLLVDAGGFDTGAAAIMTAAGYDLVVPDAVMADWAITSISMNNEGLKAGAMFDKNGVKIAFVGVAPMGETEAAAYYDAIQGAVTAARDTGAEFVIALGFVDDANGLIENVPGIDAILTYGETAVKALPGDVEESAEEEETEETEETEEEVEADAQALLVSVGSDFESIGIITIKGNMLYAETVNAETVDALEFTESEIILALENAFQPAQNAAEEPVEEIEAAEDDGETAEETEETDATLAAEPVKEDAEELAEETEESVEETEELAEETEEPVEETEESVEEPEELTEEPVEEIEETIAEDAAAESPTDASVDDDTTDDSDDETSTPTDADDVPSTDLVEYERGLEDLQLTFENPVASVKVNGSLFEDRYYALSNENKTIDIQADVLNAWGDGNYQFTFEFTDGAEAEVVTVNISGTAPVTATNTPEPTATPVPTEEPSATPVPEKTETTNNNNKGNALATGDSSPIGLYAAILGVMVVALAVVIVLIVRKKKMQQK